MPSNGAVKKSEADYGAKFGKIFLARAPLVPRAI
jgi:hypothetical protein